MRRTTSIQKMGTEFHSYGVDLASVLVWAIREQQLSSNLMDVPLGGKRVPRAAYFLCFTVDIYKYCVACVVNDFQ